MTLYENFLRNKVKRDAEKEYVHTLFDKLSEELLQFQFKVVLSKDNKFTFCSLKDSTKTAVNKTCLVQRNTDIFADPIRSLECTVNWLIENASILRRIIDMIEFPAKIILKPIDKPESHIPGYISVENKETCQTVSYYVKNNNIVTLYNKLSSTSDTETILEVSQALFYI